MDVWLLGAWISYPDTHAGRWWRLHTDPDDAVSGVRNTSVLLFKKLLDWF